MALIECKDCGRSISTEAVSCPQCGRPSSAAPRAVRQADHPVVHWLKVIALLCVLAIIGMVLWNIPEKARKDVKNRRPTGTQGFPTVDGPPR